MIIQNRRAKFKFNLKEKLEVGLSLHGNEIKGIRSGKVSLEESFVRITGGEAYLVGAYIAPYQAEKGDPKRDRKLLLHKKEINSLYGKVSRLGLTIIPTKVYTKAGKIKVEIALASSKKVADKRAFLKEKDVKREIERTLREEKLKFQKESRV